MAVFKCKMCGGNLDVTEGVRICKCGYCRTTQTVPDISNEKKLRLFDNANKLRFECEFDRAYDAYNAIIAEFPDEAEAYWGCCLCCYGIEYVDDPATGDKIPTCHRTSFRSILDDSNFHMAIECSDYASQKMYQAEAELIDLIQKRIITVATGEEPFDVFICYKESDKGSRTEDSLLAQEIYNRLTADGFKVFFARETLKDKLGKEFEPYIFSAINTARIMIAVGSKTEFFNSVWVKNEWSRFLEFMKRDKGKVLIPCCFNMSVTELPSELQGFQAQNFNDSQAMETLAECVRDIKNASADTEAELKSVFSRYETQLKNERARLKAYDNELHQRAVEEKKNAEMLYRKERVPVGLLLVLDAVASFLFTFITLGVMMGFDVDKPELIFVVWIVTFLLPIIIGAPYVMKRNRKAQEKLYERLSYDENAPGYDYGSSAQSRSKTVRESAEKLYLKERISPLVSGALFVVHMFTALFSAGVSCVLYEEITGKVPNEMLVILMWYIVPPVVVGFLIHKVNKRAKKRLEKRLRGEIL
ncbi:MAG: toll/interleukin-1 receptor domain-containing protein [Ruminococcus sp.]|nr:toll/interleukin-1 receptor domain-containing protein [Ruminococcus sp.]